MKFSISKKTREYLSAPKSELTFREKLIKSNAVDLHNNIKFITIKKDYVIIQPIDPEKRIK